MGARAGLVAALVLLAVPAAAGAQVSGAQGTITGSGTNYVLVVRNTGQTAIQCMRFTAASGVVVTGASGPGQVTTSSTGFASQNVGLAAGATAEFPFTTQQPYPENAGGTLFVSPDCNADFPAGVSGPAPAVAPPPPPPGPQPVAGRSEVAEPISGRSFYRPGGRGPFRPITSATLIPDGSEIDTRRGRIRLTVAGDRAGLTTESAEVAEGRAIVDQDSAADPTTTLRLSEPLTGCRPARRATASARRRGARRRGARRRQVFVRTRGGRFRTQGRYAAAIATGTAWRTIDTCSATAIVVTEGTVRVTNRLRRRSFAVTAPRRTTVRAPRR